MVQSKPKSKSKSSRLSNQSLVNKNLNSLPPGSSPTSSSSIPLLSPLSTYLSAVRVNDFTVFSSLPFSHFPSLCSEFFSLRTSEGRSIIHSMEQLNPFTNRFLNWCNQFPQFSTLLLSLDSYGQSFLHYLINYNRFSLVRWFFFHRYLEPFLSSSSLDHSNSLSLLPIDSFPLPSSDLFSRLSELISVFSFTDLSGKFCFHLIESAEMFDLISELISSFRTIANWWPIESERILLQSSLLFNFDWNLQSSIGLESLLMAAARKNLIQLADRLINIENRSIRLNSVNSFGRSALHLACESGYLELVKLFVSSFSLSSPLFFEFLFQVDFSGFSALHFACLGSYPEHESHTSLVFYLLSLGFPVNSRSNTGLTPLHVCTDTPAARLLVKFGADLNARDDQGAAPIHYASHENSVFLLELNQLIDSDSLPVDPEPIDFFGRSPLHLAVEEDKIFLLVRSGCSINRVDNQGRTPLDCAIETEREEVERAIKAIKGAKTAKQIEREEMSKRMIKQVGRISSWFIGLMIAGIIKRK